MARMRTPSRPARHPWRSITRTQRRGRPGITPEFPVCRVRAAAPSRPPESGWSVSIAWTLSTKPTLSGHPAGFTTGDAQIGKDCRSEASLPSSRSGRAWPRRRDGIVGAHGSSCPMRSPSGPREKTAEHVQAGSIPPPIAPMSPGASICPSGNQGAVVTCNFRVTEWLDRPAAKKTFVDHNLG